MLAATWLLPAAPWGNWLERRSSGAGNGQGKEGNSRAVPGLGPEEDALLSRGASPCPGLQPLERWGDWCRHVWGKGQQLGWCWLPKLPWSCIGALQAPHGASAMPQPPLPGPPRTDCVCFSSARSLDESGRVDLIKLGNTQINVLGSADGRNSLARRAGDGSTPQQALTAAALQQPSDTPSPRRSARWPAPRRGSARWGCRPSPWEGALGDGAGAGSPTHAQCSPVGFFPPALPAEHCLGLWLRPGSSPFCLPTALVPSNALAVSPGAAPSASRQPAMGVPRLPRSH